MTITLKDLEKSVPDVVPLHTIVIGKPFEKTYKKIRAMYEDKYGEGSFEKITAEDGEAGNKELSKSIHERYMKAKERLGKWAGSKPQYGKPVAEAGKKKGKKK